MLHDPVRAARADRANDPRPRSAVSGGVGIAGVAGLASWIAVARRFGMDGPWSALVGLAACALPMIGWSLAIDKVHRRASTGIGWASPRPWRETVDTSLVKLAGLWATWGGMALIYFAGRFYWQGPFAFAMWCLAWIAPAAFVVSVPYVLWLDRRLESPRDGAWALGAWLTGAPADAPAIAGHLRAWAVKAFFLPFMLAIVPPGFAQVVRADLSRAAGDPVALSNLLTTLMFVVDVALASVGYLLTLRPLDSHIRSANPWAAAWAAALVCYPPLILMGTNGPLDYHPGTADWTWWLAGHPLLLAAWGAALVALTAVYAAATCAFGLRFSNLTNRGTLTHGVYAWSRHPAYLSKNAFWWLSTLPMLTTGSVTDALRATLLLGVVGGVYWWRATTEERHLLPDPDYRAYWDWMERRGPVPRAFRWMTRGSV
ncbi:isoprenylcysteine carboxylmethyltransferase family protein [Sphingomonas bacterium]|uniref:isoprenylcysteine carboxylmethyltransferase family protein n=1 Tax=Sphingomonas bacterium TaxID=1895847 RepID=UPI001576204E|nr:isoprenylcysteine carboxylmethyltransferase family protein [Sphingomonas bacterium]